MRRLGLKSVKDLYYTNRNFLNEQMDHLSKYLVLYPQLMERPIVFNKTTAVIARPVELLDKINFRE